MIISKRVDVMRKYGYKLLSMWCLCVLVRGIGFGQTSDLSNNQAEQFANGKSFKGAGIWFKNATGDEKLISPTNFDETIDVIVVFNDNPMIQANKENIFSYSGYLESFRSRIHRFEADLATINGRSMQKMSNMSNTKNVINRTYCRTIAGVALKAHRAVVDEIRKLSYVKGIYLDAEVRAVMNETIQLTGVDKVWSDSSNHGAGITVGVFDTGIDYNQEDLGGGFGPQFKVIGGYDEVNQDADPMDDHGHGTLCARIISSNSISYPGVASDAKLMAFKVLDAGGTGFPSTIISALERAVDPDGDGDFSDRVDVISMSLGSSAGSPDDALCQAIDNLTTLGVVVCVAAGNTGNEYSIGSPGTAFTAITVGASDKEDNMALFSSRGPGKGEFALKPEITAPGVNLALHGGHFFTGTSAATPVVAGICALIKSRRPYLTPAKIKSMLVHTAKDIGSKTIEQGAGRVQAKKAYDLTAFVVPSIVNFGSLNTSDAVLSKSKISKAHSSSNYSKWDTLWAFNAASSFQNFSVTASSKYVGVTLTAQPSSFGLSPGDSQMVTLHIDVDAQQIPPLDGYALYDGDILFAGSIDTMRVLYSFSNLSRIKITFDHWDHILFVQTTDPSNFIPIVGWLSPTNAVEMVIPRGKYDIMAIYGMFTPEDTIKVVWRTAQNVSGLYSESYGHALAENDLSVASFGIDGSPLRVGKKLISAFGDGRITIATFSQGFRVSSLPQKKLFFHQVYTDKAERYCYLLPPHVFNGINNHFVKTSHASEKKFIRLDVNTNQLDNSFVFSSDFFTSSMNSDPSYKIYVLKLDGETPENVKIDDTPLTMSANSKTDNRFILGPSLVFGQDSLSIYSVAPEDNWPTTRRRKQFFFERIPYEASIRYGDVPATIVPYSYVSGPQSKLNSAYAYVNYSGSVDLFGSIGGLKNRLYEGSKLVATVDNLNGAHGFSDYPLDKSKSYRLEISDIKNRSGIATINQYFKPLNSEGYLPVITNVKCVDEAGKLISDINNGEKADVFFSAGNPIFNKGSQYYLSLDSVWAYYRLDGEETWWSLPVNKLYLDTTIGQWYSFPLNKFQNLSDSYVNLKLVIKDQLENKTEAIFTHAIKIGKPDIPSSFTVDLTALPILAANKIRWVAFSHRAIKSINITVENDTIPLKNIENQWYGDTEFVPGKTFNVVLSSKDLNDQEYSLNRSYVAGGVNKTMQVSDFLLTPEGNNGLVIARTDSVTNVPSGCVAMSEAVHLSSSSEVREIKVKWDNKNVSTSTNIERMNEPLAHDGIYCWHNDEWHYVGHANTTTLSKPNVNGIIAVFRNVIGDAIPDRFVLSQNYPNPFNPETTVRYGIPKESQIKLSIYNLLGQLVKELYNGVSPAGYHLMRWDGKDKMGRMASSGVYLLRIQAGRFTATKKIMLLK